MSEKPRVVIDTQVFLQAAINRKSLPTKVVFDASDYYDLITVPPIIAEIRDVLHRPKLCQKFTQLTDEIANSIFRLLHEAENITSKIIVSNPPMEHRKGVGRSALSLLSSSLHFLQH